MDEFEVAIFLVSLVFKFVYNKKKMLIFARAYSFTTQTNFNPQILKRYLMCQAHTRVLRDPIFNTIHFI